MKNYRFKVFRNMVMHVKADLSSSQVDACAIFRQLMVDFNMNRSEII
jgi:hypothetical protein